MGVAVQRERYQLKSFKYGSHYWVLKTLAAEQAPLRILDVGTATGYLGRVLRSSGHYVVGIEGHGDWAAKAQEHYDSFHVADLEQFEFPFRSEFDYIVLADILEHLRDPIAVLRRAIPSLRKSGKIIVSVPNVANFVVRLSLLFGRFDYVDRGILDRTHLRFFTLRSLKKLLLEASCRTIRVMATPVPVQLILPITDNSLFTPLHEVHYAAVRLWKTMFGYQFVVTAAPESARRAS
jgi:2-polyprenyl-3-methyl-5-hydroxy-6-metoxy-1,4-benzoquinol methylase